MVLKKPITEVSEAEYDTMFAVNTKAAFFFLIVFVPLAVAAIVIWRFAGR